MWILTNYINTIGIDIVSKITGDSNYDELIRLAVQALI
jgi:hypothetical protein